ncbi:MAG TPA: hypothetical protein VEU09_05120 [Candidatus Binatia bacterium]|nr:hypothetical protein [Candidatus Binatia bacterium]
MSWRRSILAGFLATLATVGAAQGQALIQYNLLPVPSPSPYPADWQTSSSLGTMAFTQPEPFTGNIQAVLTSPEGTWATIPSVRSFPASPVLYTPQLAAWTTLALTGKVRESVEKTGHLPDGTYTLVIFIRNIQGVSGQPYQDVLGIMRFPVSVPQPPSLLYPSNQSEVAVPYPVFQWTPTFRASGSQPIYRFRLVELLPMQTPLQAIEANYPLLETYVQNRTALVYPVAALALQQSRTYAWQVQAIAPPAAGVPATQITPVGANEGRSQVYTFRWRPRARPVVAGADDVQGSLDPGMTGHESQDPIRGEATAAPGAGLRNFADRLLHAMVGRWKPARAGFASALPAAQGPTSYGPTFPVAAPDSAMAPLEAPPDTAAPATPPPAPAPEQAQEQGMGPQWLKLHGRASASDETYSREGSGSPTRPFHSARVTTGLSFGLMNDRMRVPFDALVSGDQVAFRQNINQFALHPQLSWAGLQAGNLSPQYSTYTLADATVLGAGFELTPRKWHIGFADGKSRKAIAADPTALVQPQYARNMTAGRIGYGDPMATMLEVSVLRARDDQNSLSDADTALVTTPEANTVYGLKAQRMLPKLHLSAQVESAWSLYDRDRRADAASVKGRAVGLKLSRETVLSSVGATFESLNGGFVSLGNSGVANDRVTIGLTGRTQLRSGKLLLNGTAGWRNDNVSKTLLAETARRDYSLNASWMPRPSFGTDFQFGFMTSDADAADSVAGSSNITRIVAFSPHLTYAARGIQQALTGSATLQSSDNNTTAPIPLANVHSTTLLLNWSATVSPVLALSFGGNYTRTDLEVAVSEISGFGPGFVWSLPRARIGTTAQLDFTRSRTGNSGTDTQFAPRCEVRWQTTPRHALIARGNFRRYRYAVGTPEFDERVASLEYAITL